MPPAKSLSAGSPELAPLSEWTVLVWGAVISHALDFGVFPRQYQQDSSTRLLRWLIPGISFASD